jgi:membrane-associated phospholipid phosphatase
MCTAPVVADVVTDWNTMYIEAIRQTGGPPCPIARAGAIVHAAMYDAINSIVQTHEPYAMPTTAPATTSQEAAIAVAAHDALSAVYPQPELLAMFDAMLAAHLDAIPDGPDKDAGMALGGTCAAGIMALRANDGADNDDPYVFGKGPGHWIPTPPDYTAPLSPNWPGVTPFTMTSSDQFRPLALGPAGYTNMTDLLLSPEYAAAYDDVKSIGAIDSATRTAEQTLIARFWANDRDGTFKPPGHLNYIAQVVADQQGNTLFENARLFALLNLALGDAGIVAWDTKYSYDIDLWRPITGIRQGNTDGNPATIVDMRWTPLSHDPEVNGFTPAFPAWASGHATFGAAHAAVLREFYGTDAITITIGSDDTPGEFRTYDTLTEAAIENGRSRVYLGVHWQLDADAGYDAGTRLGAYVVQNFLRPLDEAPTYGLDDLLAVLANWGECPGGPSCPGDLDGDGLVGLDDLLVVLSNWAG